MTKLHFFVVWKLNRLDLFLKHENLTSFLDSSRSCDIAIVWKICWFWFKVSKSQKKIMTSWIFSKNKRWNNFDTIFFLRDLLTFGFRIRPKFTTIFGFSIGFNPKPKPGFGHRLASFVQFPGFSQASPNFKSAYFALWLFRHAVPHSKKVAFRYLLYDIISFLHSS